MMRSLFILLGLLVATSAKADIQCFGSVTDLLIYNDGEVNIQTTYRNSYTHICNLKVTRQGVDTFTCALWVGLIESARKLNQTIHVYYSTNNGFTCETIPFFDQSPAPLYIGH